MQTYVKDFQKIGHSDLLQVGGKGLNLGQLAKMPGIQVPAGFCVTTDAFKKMLAGHTEAEELLGKLSLLTRDDKEKIREVSAHLRSLVESLAIPLEIEQEIISAIEELGEGTAFAVRSSATAEDLPAASFAGQQDSFLNIRGKREILRHVSKCWASLFTERAVVYRIQNGFDHRKVHLSVVVQRMVFPQASGILFTADPVTSNRRVTSIDASFGLGEALVSGIVSADNYKVREGRIVQKTIASKKVAFYPRPDGATEKREVSPAVQKKQAIEDEQIVALEKLGRQVESRFGKPQDIEWCLADGAIYIVQSRPITTLYPLPEKRDDHYRIFFSVGHQQMMTDPIKPLGISFFGYMPDYELIHAGGRLFVDLTHDLASFSGRKIAVSSLGSNDPLMKQALLNFLERKPKLTKGKRVFKLGNDYLPWTFPAVLAKVYRDNDRRLAGQLINRSEAYIRELEWRIEEVSGDELFALILEDQKELRKSAYDQRGIAAILIGAYATHWLNKNMENWLGEKNAADVLSQSINNNVTSEMGRELLDVADAVRAYPEVLAYFEHPDRNAFFKDLEKLEGGPEASRVIRDYLSKYGMRCAGEIDIAKTRWSEDPTILMPPILSNIKNFPPNARQAMVEEGKRRAAQKTEELLQRLAQQPGGKRKAKKTRHMISLLQNFLGYREYPKFALVKHLFLYKQALKKEAVLLQQKGAIQEPEDVYYLTFEEFREAVNGKALNWQVLEERKTAYRHYDKLTPPRLMTSEGEEIFGSYQTDRLPEGALAGIGVSAGTVEGRARVVFKMEQARLESGDILVTAFTDPSWTPLFVSAAGLVTEVGGLMTHGAVIAREYGLPAVVGVENATKTIKDGQRIRINGSEGYVEIME